MPDRRCQGVQKLLILGAAGDLTDRLLLPGLATLLVSGGVGDLLSIGSHRDDWDDDGWRARVMHSFATVDAEGPPSPRSSSARAITARTRRARTTCGG